MSLLKPKTKAMWIPYINEDSTGVSIGGFQPGIARLIETETPSELLTVLSYCDGQNSIEQIASLLTLPLGETEAIIDSLFDIGLLYLDIADYTNFSADEITYYSRNINFFAWLDTEGKYLNYWDAQLKLKTSHVLILGCGGTGSECAISLARLGIGSITIVDYDVVELNNLNRQCYSYNDIGKEKGLALKEYMLKINPFITVNYISKKIETCSDIIETGVSYDLMICCIDKPRDINLIIEEYTKTTGIPRLIGGYASTVITMGLFLKSSPLMSHLIDKSAKLNYDAYMVSENTYWAWENAVISPVSKMAGNFSALFAMYFLTDLKNISDGEILHLDLFNLQNEHAIYSFK